MSIIFITGTDTDIGKTVVSSWLMMNSNYIYWKPIQTGSLEELNDTLVVKNLARVNANRLLQPLFSFKEPLSPHIAAKKQNMEINLKEIHLPKNTKKILIEGAGGVLVPINLKNTMADLISFFNAKTIIVARSSLGTINHTCLTIEVLKKRNIQILGVITVGDFNIENKRSIEYFSKTKVLAHIPKINILSYDSLSRIKINQKIKDILKND